MKISQEIHSALDAKLRLAFRPPPRLKVWEWAEREVFLTPKTGTFSPGRYRTRHTPHVKEVMEAFQDQDVKYIVLAFAAQTAKTLTETICIAWAIENDPGNMLFVMPSEPMAKSFSSNRLQQVIEDSPSVCNHKSGSKKFNVLEMELDNCVIALAGAGSASNLASRPIRYLFLDEEDKYPKKLGDEGNPRTLAIERTKTFPNAKIFESSTPTTDMGEICTSLKETDCREWFCPCPKCKREFIPKWDYMVFPEEGSDEERGQKSALKCPNCGHLIKESDRRSFLSKGHWNPTRVGKTGKVGFHISEMSSCIGRPWPELVKTFLSATRRSKSGYHEDLKTFVCSVLAEPWHVNTDTMRKSDDFLSLRTDYLMGNVPTYMPISGLTAGIDTQDNGFYYVVRAWGGGESLESWLIDYGFCNNLGELEDVLNRKYPSEDGLTNYTISGCFMDAMGHRTPEVYNFCRNNGRAARVIPTKGELVINGGVQYSFAAIDRDQRGRSIPGSLQLCHINTTLFKDWLDGKLHISSEDIGAWHLPEDVDSEYCNQMASEYRDEDGRWQLRSSQARNHYWDCETLALARAVSLRLDKYNPTPHKQQMYEPSHVNNDGKRNSRY